MGVEDIEDWGALWAEIGRHFVRIGTLPEAVTAAAQAVATEDDEAFAEELTDEVYGWALWDIEHPVIGMSWTGSMVGDSGGMCILDFAPDARCLCYDSNPSRARTMRCSADTTRPTRTG